MNPTPADSRSPLARRLRARIESSGPIPFPAFMEAALYDPDEGFYSRVPVGERGHFVTSPHVSAAYAALLAHQVARFWEVLGGPDGFSLVEVGAGDGTLARQLLPRLPPRMRQRARYLAVERSAAARRRLAAAGLEAFAGLTEVPPVSNGCVLANELIDNLPFHWVRGTEKGLVELHVGVTEDGFLLEEHALSSPELASAGPSLPPGREAVVSLEALRFLDQAAAVLGRGYIWIVDYSSPPDEESASVHGYRDQQVVDDVLSAPGSRDITAGVDFEVLVRHSRERGLTVWGPVSQREALLALGFTAWDLRERERQVEASREGRPLDAARIYSERNAAKLLVDPAGMGGFTVLCLGVGTSSSPVSWGRGGVVRTH